MRHDVGDRMGASRGTCNWRLHYMQDKRQLYVAQNLPPLVVCKICSLCWQMGEAPWEVVMASQGAFGGAPRRKAAALSKGRGVNVFPGDIALLCPYLL